MISLCSSCQKVFSISTDDFNGEETTGCSQTQCLELTSSENNSDIDSSRVQVGPSTSEDGTQAHVNPSSPSEAEESVSCEHSAVMCEQPDPKRAKFNGSGPDDDKACTLCLGLLDGMYFETLTQTVVDELDRSQYSGIETFSLSIHTPLSLLIRQKGIVLFAESNDPTHSNEQLVKEELREMLKLSIPRRVPHLTYSMDSPFQIVIKFSHEQSNIDCMTLRKMKPNSFGHPRRRGRRKPRLPESSTINNVSINRALEDISVEDFLQNKSLLSAVDGCSYKVEFLHSSLFVAGRYNKYSRHLPQTPWVIDGFKKAETSVEELISPQLVALAKATSEKFSASGREDVDVRMLGNGRPFVVELMNPHKVVLSEEELFEVSERINKSTELVAVRQLKLISKKSLSLIKEGEEEKRKHYCAFIWVEGEITPEDLECVASIKHVTIAQKTPIRVLHRRTLATRQRTVYSMSTKFIDAHHFKLYLCTQAGTYIKEFVHGDFGRTVPNLGTLLKQNVDILTLDVEDVDLVWPPP